MLTALLSILMIPGCVFAEKDFSATPGLFSGFATEYNVDTRVRLSSGMNGCPIQEITLTVFCSEDIDPAPGEPVSISPILNSSYIESNNLAGFTDFTGRHYATIKAKQGITIPDGTIVRLRAQWPRPGFTISKEIEVELVSRPYPGLTTPTQWVKLPDGNNIQYTHNPPSWMHSYVVQSRSTWTIPGKINFPATGTQIQWIPGWDNSFPADAYAATSQNNGMLPRIIRFNPFTMNGNPLTNGSWYAPVEKRHHVQTVANHELGHAIFLGHHASRTAALMYFNIECYFIHGTVNPTDGDKFLIVDPVFGQYP
jgi:hypothetical protein